MDFHTSYFSTPARAFDDRIFVVELALKGVSYIVTNTFRAVKYPCEVFTLVFYARKIFRRFDVDTVTCFVRRAGTAEWKLVYNQVAG